MRPSTLVLGYHGCDRSVGEQLVAGKTDIRSSSNDYDRLGHGAYFWENSSKRALDWATFLRDHPKAARTKITSPCAVGAIIELGYIELGYIELGNCLDLTEAESLELIRAAYENLKEVFHVAGAPLPKNARGNSRDEDLILRNLDCAVINWLHDVRTAEALEPFDTVRGAFFEGEDLYEGAGIKAKTHIQICVRSTARIRGFFWPRPPH